MAKLPNGVKITENYKGLTRAHERYRRQADDRRTGDSIANVNVSSRSPIKLF